MRKLQGTQMLGVLCCCSHASLNHLLLPFSSVQSSSLCSFTLPKPTINASITTKSRKPKISISVASNRASVQIHEAYWEDPAEGSDSDCDDELGLQRLNFVDIFGEVAEEEEEQGREEALGEAVGNVNSAAIQYEEQLIREVEQLLEPQERAILQQNKYPNLSRISSPKWSPFHTFALSLQIPLMDKVLECGVDIDAIDKDGFTALHKAVIGKKEAVISHLLRKGANPNVRDKDGATPLHFAIQVGAMQTVKLFIKYKVDVNAADNEGWTPLHVAVQSRCRDIAKVLLVNGADKTRRNSEGKTPLDLGLCFGKDFKSYEISKLLKLVPANRDP